MSGPSLLQTCCNVIQAGLGIDPEVLFGALLGSLLVSLARGRMKVWLMLGADDRLSLRKSSLLVVLSAGVGCLFEPLILTLAPLLSSGMAAFSAAVVVIPISLKIMVWLDGLDLRDLLQRLRRRG
ncbi:hypothetical protein [Pseudomonas cremoricolorata]|uniref:Uncharacterized protein n=1 Tax=Pseudomonas cremoricolorata TaxID=157783 RepID=A0A089WXK7_9PSED|nr:hypothetical protein [Pseudomonas cremoricolorata]AIR91372.1 hypothetical protein LK03_19790 [Pseudomonas cremoricolorata]